MYVSNSSGCEVSVSADEKVVGGFEAFYRSEYPAALRLAWLITGSRVAAEDVVHDAMAAVYREYARVERPTPYLRRAVINGSRSWQRNERRRHERVDRLVADARESAGEDLDLLHAIASRPQRMRVVVIARYWGGWSEAEIADALGCRPGTVKSLAARALKRLRTEVAE